jgi:hypothetical protein
MKLENSVRGEIGFGRETQKYLAENSALTMAITGHGTG